MEHNTETARDRIRDSIGLTQRLFDDEEISGLIVRAAEAMSQSLKQGGRLLFCGNGGSAADAQHFAAELSGKFLIDREPLDAEALHVNSSFLTAVANDYGYAEIYSRMVYAKGRSGDVLIGISTSGNSANIVHAFESAHRIGMRTIGLTGEGGGRMAGLSDVLIAVPSRSAPRIQESHLLIGHILCELVEAACCERSEIE
jgi:D-sedoheptulose 7-phosphate isomerase